MEQESAIQVQCVHGGFILQTHDPTAGARTEVFTSQGKLMKALRTAIDKASLVAKVKAEKEDDDKSLD